MTGLMTEALSSKQRSANSIVAAFICFFAAPLAIADATVDDVTTASAKNSQTIELLSEQRQSLTMELEQYERTLELLNPGGESPEESANPAVRGLAHQAMLVKEQLVAIAAEEVTLLQRQINGSAAASAEQFEETPEDEVLVTAAADTPRTSYETKPLRSFSGDEIDDKEAGNVERLHELLEDYFAQLQHSANILPTDEEVAMREKSQRELETLAKIPYSADKVRLTGPEGSTALAQITRRLMNPAIPESRRDSVPIASIKTYLFDTLVASENRSLQPVGKNHFIARIKLQPGESTLSILADRWEVSLAQQATASDYLITFYKPPGRSAQLHIFAVEDLLAHDDAHIPQWLPEELKVQKNRG